MVGTDAAPVETNLGWRPVPTKVGTYQGVGGCQPLVGTDAAPVEANLGWRPVPTKVGTYQSGCLRHTHADVTSLR
ncbi:hypothetical protein ACVLL5_000414 [Stenotrophomonas sp. PvP087]